jgi:hypothetical protein
MTKEDGQFDVAVAPGSAALLQMLAQMLRGSPKIPPGATIRNRALAGKKHPETGVPFDKDGFADFSGVATKTVRVPHTGSHRLDSAAANRAAGHTETPPNMRWHHEPDGHTMRLVPRDIHEKTGHTGSIGLGNLPGKK